MIDSFKAVELMLYHHLFILLQSYSLKGGKKSYLCDAWG